MRRSTLGQAVQAFVENSDPPTGLQHLAGLSLKVPDREVELWAISVAAHTPCHDAGAIYDQLDSGPRQGVAPRSLQSMNNR